ncbi:MAG: OmpA family protein [Polyangia bacterium]|jgi:outer membrane protein OmpA-like peptidoglycan-associated protein|nr:OmpA family protein [Polyangia bacterium]
MPAAVAIAILSILLFSATTARAEEGRVNVHLGLGAGLLLSDAAVEAVDSAGLDFSLKIDLPLHRFIAPQLGYGLVYLPGQGGAEVGVNMIMAGARVRLLNDERGYLSNIWPKAPKGNAWGNLWVDLGIGYAHAPTVSSGSNWFALEFGLGYEFSLLGPLQIGPYISYRHVFKTSTDASFLAIGVSLSFGYPKRLPKSEPLPRAEPEPEVRPNIRGRPGDADGDGVADTADRCPSTPPEAQVDEHGCESLRGRMLFPGIKWKGDTSDLAPGAIFEIRRVAELLKANPRVLAEIGSHSESSLSVEENLRLSLRRAQVVRDELQRMGVYATQLTVRGYGTSVPVLRDGSKEERRRANERIELRFTLEQSP